MAKNSGACRRSCTHQLRLAGSSAGAYRPDRQPDPVEHGGAEHEPPDTHARQRDAGRQDHGHQHDEEPEVLPGPVHQQGDRIGRLALDERGKAGAEPAAPRQLGEIGDPVEEAGGGVEDGEVPHVRARGAGRPVARQARPEVLARQQQEERHGGAADDVERELPDPDVVHARGADEHLAVADDDDQHREDAEGVDTTSPQPDRSGAMPGRAAGCTTVHELAAGSFVRSRRRARMSRVPESRAIGSAPQ